MSDPDVLPDSAHRMTAAVWMVLLAVGLAVGIGALGKVELAPRCGASMHGSTAARKPR